MAKETDENLTPSAKASAAEKPSAAASSSVPVVTDKRSAEPALSRDAPAAEAKASAQAAAAGAGDKSSAAANADLPDDELGRPAAHKAQDAPARPAGRLLAGTACLLALAGLAAVGYLYFQLIYLDPSAKLERSLAQARAENAALRSSLSQAQEQWRQALADASAQHLDRLRSTEAGLVQRMVQAAGAPPPSERDWKLAELEYLLRVANHRLLMEGDIASALALLRSADEVLQGLADLSLHEVRAALAAEILSLEQTQGVDVQGLYLRLDAVKPQLADLALAQPQFAPPRKATAGAGGQEAGFWAALADEFHSLLQFRRIDAEIRPLLAPDEALYLELNLRLMLEQAQLAALRRDPVVYATSLDAARQWVGDHLDGAEPGVQAVSAALAELRQADLNVALPDISASLEELRKVRRGGAEG